MNGRLTVPTLLLDDLDHVLGIVGQVAHCSLLLLLVRAREDDEHLPLVVLGELDDAAGGELVQHRRQRPALDPAYRHQLVGGLSAAFRRVQGGKDLLLQSCVVLLGTLRRRLSHGALSAAAWSLVTVLASPVPQASGTHHRSGMSRTHATITVRVSDHALAWRAARTRSTPPSHPGGSAGNSSAEQVLIFC